MQDFRSLQHDLVIPEHVIIACEESDIKVVKSKMDLINRELRQVWDILSGRAMSRSASCSSDYADSEVSSLPVRGLDMLACAAVAVAGTGGL